MNKTMRTVSAAVVATLALGLLGACGETSSDCEDEATSMSFVTGRGGSSGGGGGRGGGGGGKGGGGKSSGGVKPGKSSGGVKPGKVHADIDGCDGDDE